MRVLLVNDTEKPIGELRQALTRAGYTAMVAGVTAYVVDGGASAAGVDRAGWRLRGLRGLRRKAACASAWTMCSRRCRTAS